MFIPWDQFQASDVLVVQGTDSVAQVRDRLLAAGGPAQHLSAMVILLPDGRVVPTTVSQLKELAKKLGRRILPSPIGSLAEDLCPRPWEISDQLPGVCEAETLASRRRMPILVTSKGERVGLVRPLREIESYKSSQGLSFDLFDQSVPEGTGEPFVWFPEKAPLARVAQDLRPYRGTPLVYVLLQLADGGFKLSTKAGLNRAIVELSAGMKSGPTKVWELPLQQLEAAFSETCQVRDLEDMSGTQAKSLSRSKALVLVRDGSPASLYPGGLRDAFPYGTAKGGGYDLDTIPYSVLDSVYSMPRALLEPEPEPRFVNLWFEDADRSAIPGGQSLVVGRAYHLALNVGRLLQDSIIDWDRAPAGAQAIVEPQAEDALLYVSLNSQDFEIPEPTQSLRLPKKGDSDLVRFQAVPLDRTWGTDLATLEVCLFYRTYLVQTFRVRAEVVAAGETAHGAHPQIARLIHARTASFPDMAKLPPRDLSLTITRDGADRYRFTFLVDPGDNGPVAGREQGTGPVELFCHVHMTRDDLTHLITKARRQLYNVVQAFDLLQERDTRTYRMATRALAQVGRQLYLRLFASASAQALRDWMEEILPDGSTIQVVDLAGDFCFPWSLVYTAQPWDDDEPVDVEKFWGWRYEIALLTSRMLDTYRQARTEMPTDDALCISVGMYERLVGAAEQKAFFAALDSRSGHRVLPEIVTSRRKMGRKLAGADQDLYYFFCHGYTERIATDIQLDADLVSQFAQQTAASLKDRPQSVREHLDDLFDVSDSWLRLTRGKIPLTMLKETVPSEFSQHPFVFLNMCESAQVLPSLSDGFVPFFLERGARAVIGTECSMNTVFADDFSRAFLTLFFQGESAGAILLTLRRRYLNEGNPLALAYTLYADANLRLDRQVLPADGPQQDAGRREQVEAQEPRVEAVDALWEDDMDGLMLTLAARVQAGDEGAAQDELQLWDPPEVAFAADTEAGPEWTAKMIAYGQEWWDKLEPKLYDVLCNKSNEQHDELMTALQDGVKMLAAALAPTLVAQVAALPAIAIVVATIAAKKIAESGLETACQLWGDSVASQAESE